MNETDSSSRSIETIRLAGSISYSEAYRMQRTRREAVESGRMGNALFLLEHAPVVTLGRKTHSDHVLCSPQELQTLGIELHDADRGGDVTYHGPGQLVAYPVLNLRLWRPSIRWYLRALEEILIRTLACYGLAGERMEGLTGVWVGGAKVAAIGIGIHNWVTFHGVSLNVDPDMTHFQVIVPCGIPDKPVTSLACLLNTCPAMASVMDAFEECFVGYFGVSS